jgi:hypothetical protein
MAMAPGFSLSLVWGNLLEATCSALVASPVMSVLMLFRSSLGIRDPRDLTRVL